MTLIQLPPKDTSPEIAALWERYDERNCPVWAYGAFLVYFSAFRVLT